MRFDADVYCIQENRSNARVMVVVVVLLLMLLVAVVCCW